MHNLISKLLVYSDLGDDCILVKLADIFEKFDAGELSVDDAVSLTYKQIKNLLDISTAYGFKKNLWQNYLTFILVTNENSFTLTCEGQGYTENGSINIFAKNDFKIFKQLFDFDFSSYEQKLGIDCFSVITNYTSIKKRDVLYNSSVSEKVTSLSERIAATDDIEEIFEIITDHYKYCGVGMFGLNRAFRLKEGTDDVEFVPINNADSVTLKDLVGYEIQKKKLVANTEAFVNGKKANNALLYGDAGTGKSSSIIAVLNEYYPKGLRMIEIYKHQFRQLATVISQVKNRNYRFIIYIDDLSFEENEIEYKFLKAVIEGGVETRPENVLIYATSNRRHLIKETWNDRNDMEYNGEIHHSDTLEEKMSLSSRFGVTINFSIPDREEFYEIVRTLAKREGITLDEKQLLLEANRWELRHGGVSCRTAKQFVDYMSGAGMQTQEVK